MITFNQLANRWELRPIRNCPGRFIIHTAAAELTPRELLGSEAAIQLVTSDQLPHISYVTLMHGFVNASFMTMCATVVINLVVGTLDKRGSLERGNRIDRLCRWIFPAVYFGLLLVMFVVAMLFY